MSQFLNSLKASGTLRAKGKWAPKPISPSDKFVTAAKEQLKLLAGGTKVAKWFKLQADGSYCIWPHAGTAIMNYEGVKVELLADNQEAAAKLMEELIAAAKAGEFDQQLAEAAASLKAKRALN